MPRITVMVTGVGSCGPGEGVVKALNMVKGKYRVIGTDMNSLSAFSFLVDRGYKVPRATSTDYFSTINRICKDEKVDILIPNSDVEVDVVANNIERIDKGPFVLVHPKETVNICRDSWKTYLFLKENGFDCPESFIPDEPRKLPFPLFIKDRFGGGSRNTFKVEDEEDLKYYISYFKKHGLKPLIQKFIGTIEEEYTTGVLYSKERKLVDSITFKRKLIAGASGTMIYKEFPEVTRYAEQIAGRLKTLGSINVQCRVVDGRPYAFEINPRFSGSTPARVGVGINEVDMAIDMFYLKKRIERQAPMKNQVILRCFQEIYADMGEWERLERGEGILYCGQTKDYMERK